jgi:heat shock protein HslJ
MCRLGRRAATLLVALALVLSGCAAGAPSRALENTLWTLDSIGGGAVPAGLGATLTFNTGGTFTGFAGCNDVYGESVIREGTIEITQIGATARGCQDPAFEGPETSYLDALQGVTGWSVDGDIMTLTGTTELTFSRRQASPAAPSGSDR